MARPKRTTPWIGIRDGIFYAFWYDERERETKRISLRTSDNAEAEARFAEFLLNGREIREARPKGLTVSLVLDDYVKEHVEKNCADGQRQRDAIKHLKEFFGDRILRTVDVPLSQEYAKARYEGQIGGGKRRSNKKASPATVRRELNVLTAAANHALWMKRTTDTISVDLPPEKRLGPDDEAPYYTFDELEAIFALAREDGGEIEPFIDLLYYTGARRKSIQNLTRDQVKWRERRIILQPPGKVTTKKRQPIVPILKKMEPAISRLLDSDRKHRLFECADFYRPYKALIERAGISDGRQHPHIMRHTRATHLLQTGKSIYDVAKLLGDTVATVERVYGHHSADHLANRLED